jgi:N-acetylglucosaminyldiphosphoundecaprenol N-acetyl-beta-D-mannosaminyltransferase
MDAAEPGERWVFGVPFALLDLAGVAAAVAARAPHAPFTYICTPNAVHVVNMDRRDPRFVAGVEGAWLRICDSRVVQRLARLMFGIQIPVAPGSDLTQILVRDVIAPDDAVTVIGGSPELVDRLQTLYGMRRVALHVPPFGFADDPAQMQACIDFVITHPARYVFLACGAPQSELLGLRIRTHGGATGLGLCVGASLLFVTGLAKRAPPLWQRSGLEWLHRLIQEPGRMSRRLVAGQLPLLTVAWRYRQNPDLAQAQRRPRPVDASNPG